MPDFISLQSPYKRLEEVEEDLKGRIPIDIETQPEHSRRKLLEDHLKACLAPDLGSDDGGDVRNVMVDIIDRGIKKWREPKRHGGDEEEFSWSNWADILIDVGQHQRDKPFGDIFDADELDSHLRQARSVERAKKRFQ